MKVIALLMFIFFMLEFKLSNQVVDEDYLNKNFLKKHSFIRPYGGKRLNFSKHLFLFLIKKSLFYFIV